MFIQTQQTLTDIFLMEMFLSRFRTKRVRNSNHNMVGVLFYSCGVYACLNYPQPVNKSHINLNAIKLTDM